jgi:hypothetical protein
MKTPPPPSPPLDEGIGDFDEDNVPKGSKQPTEPVRIPLKLAPMA